MQFLSTSTSIHFVFPTLTSEHTLIRYFHFSNFSPGISSNFNLIYINLIILEASLLFLILNLIYFLSNECRSLVHYVVFIWNVCSSDPFYWIIVNSRIGSLLRSYRLIINISFLGRQSKVTCACVLSCVKHFDVAWIAWVLAQGGNHTALQWCLNFHYKSPVITVSQSTGVWVA